MAGAIVTSDYSNLTAGAITGRLGRTNAQGGRGRARMTIEIQSEPLVHNFDELQLGHAPAQAAAKALADKVRQIDTRVSESTQITRHHQEEGYRAGKSWAVRRFGGPRMGFRPPREGELRMFNHSGTFADSIVGTENRTEKSWTINVAASRLDPRTSRNAHEFSFITDALRANVPEIESPQLLAEMPEVKLAVAESIALLVVNARTQNDKLREQRLWTALGLLLPNGMVGQLQSILLP